MRKKIWLGYELSGQAFVVVFFLFLGKWGGEWLAAHTSFESAPTWGVLLGVLVGLLETLLWFLKKLKSL